MRHKVRASKYPKQTLNNVNEAVVCRTEKEFYITDTKTATKVPPYKIKTDNKTSRELF
jgi:hypothetical protein